MKKVILQTLPHSGTHTMLYLLSVLGQLDVRWHHWEPNQQAAIEDLLKHDLTSVVFVQTHRPFFSLYDSHKRRATEPFKEKYLRDCVELFESFRHYFPSPIVVPIEAPTMVRTMQALRVFEACGKMIPSTAYEYLLLWKKTNSQDELEYRGFKDDNELKKVRELIRRRLIKSEEIEEWLTS